MVEQWSPARTSAFCTAWNWDSRGIAFPAAAVHCQRLPDGKCPDEQRARADFSSQIRMTAALTPYQKVQRMADSDEGLHFQQGPHNQKGDHNHACDPSRQCCDAPFTRSAIFWWVPRHLPFYLLALFRAATDPEAFAPRQSWRRPTAPAFSGAFPPPPFAQDSDQQIRFPEEDRSSAYLFDMTSSGLGHGVPESMWRSASALVELAVYFLTEWIPFGSSLNADLKGDTLLATAISKDVAWRRNYASNGNAYSLVSLYTCCFLRATSAVHGA